MERLLRRVDLAAAIRSLKKSGKRIGFVPTMGALHEGHLSLVRLAKESCDAVVVSIFVNPTQFGPREDFARYPRKPDEDCELLTRVPVDLVYVPTLAEVYKQGEQITVDPGPIGSVFEGASRPGHFAGVLTVVAKLFLHIQPDAAVFGQKDAQQLFLVRRMVTDLGFPVEILEGTTVREADGLALSSRNAYLKVNERPRATVLFAALQRGLSLVHGGKRQLRDIQNEMRHVANLQEGIVVDYLTVVERDSFTELTEISVQSVLIGACKVGSVRLIDNIPFEL